MLILLDCRPLQKAGASGETSWFIITCVKELTARQGVQWIFLLDKGEEGLALPADGKQLVRRTLPGRLGDELWYSWLMPRMARREKVDLVMTGGEGLKTRGTSGAIKMSETNRAIKMSERNKAIKMSETNKPIKTPLCVWEMSEKGLVFSAGETEVRVPLAPDEEVRSLSAEEREKWKEETAGGREYFFADVMGLRTSKVVNLLKAFSLFKKRQLSNMRLVLAGAGTIDKLDSYKYREDICLFPGREKGSMEAAYAVIHIPRRNDPGIAVLNAWRAKAPVIMLANGAKAAQGGNGTNEAKAAKVVNEAKAAKGAYKAEGAKGVNEAKAAKADGGTNGSKGMEGADRTEGVDVAGAVLQVPADDTAGLAEALKSLYKNEGIRNELIEKGASRVADLSIRGSAAVIGELLENVRRAG